MPWRVNLQRRINVTLTVDGSKVGPGVRDSFKSAGGEGDRAGREAGKRFSGGLRSTVAKGAGLFAGLFAADKAIEFFKGAIDGASDLNEAGTKINAIFGKSGADAVQKFAAGGAQALGQTKLDVLDAASNFGTFGKAAGLAGKPLANFANGFAGLSTDLASFYNTSPEQAVEAIGAALRGEAEPIRQYGVLLDDATLRQEALRLGLVKTTKTALTPQQKVLAAQAAIYKQTKDAQGDFQRTSGGLANQQRILSATFKDTQAELGTRLLPVALKATKGVNDFIKGMQNGTGIGGTFADTAKNIGTSLKPVVSLAEGAVKGFSSLPGPVRTAVLSFVALKVATSAISGPVGSARSSVAAFATQLASSETRMAAVSKAGYALGAAARNAAGAGGMLALSSAAQTSNRSLQTLGNIGGGALLGFSLGGPYGAAIGAAGGALLTLVKRAHGAGDAFAVSKKQASEYAATLDQVTGAANKNSRANILTRLSAQGLLQIGAQQGLSSRTLVDAVLGKPAAVEQTRNAVSGLNTEAGRLKDSLKTVGGTAANPVPNAGKKLAETSKAMREASGDAKALASVYGQQAQSAADSARKTRLAYFASGDWKEILKGFPKKAVTEIKADGVEHSKAAVLDLARQYKLTPKEIVTVAGIAGYDISVKEAKDLARQARNVPGKVPVNVSTPGAPGAKKAIDAVTGAAKTAGKQKPTPKVGAETKPFFVGLNTALDHARKSSASVRVKPDTTGFASSITSFIHSLSVAVPVRGPARRAKGGPVSPSTGLTLVGENGPELVEWAGRGNVIPNDKISGSRAMSVAPAAASGAGFSGDLHLYDSDGVLMGTMYAVADDAVASNASLVSQGR